MKEVRYGDQKAEATTTAALTDWRGLYLTSSLEEEVGSEDGVLTTTEEYTLPESHKVEWSCLGFLSIATVKSPPSLLVKRRLNVLAIFIFVSGFMANVLNARGMGGLFELLASCLRVSSTLFPRRRQSSPGRMQYYFSVAHSTTLASTENLLRYRRYLIASM
jgi:hypothetical protein